MYKKTSYEQILEVLEANHDCFFSELEELPDLAEEENSAFYLSDDCALVLSVRRKRSLVYAMPLQKGFKLSELEAFLSKQFDQFHMSLNTTLNPAGALRFTEPYEVSGEVASLKAPSNVKSKVKLPGTIRLLTEADARHVRNFKQARSGFAMSLRETFELLVMDEVGKILAYFDEEQQLAAYVSFTETLLGAWAVDDFYVLPAYADGPVGIVLLEHVASMAAAEQVELFWPAVPNEQKVELAMAAGFVKVANRITVETF